MYLYYNLTLGELSYGPFVFRSMDTIYPFLSWEFIILFFSVRMYAQGWYKMSTSQDFYPELTFSIDTVLYKHCEHYSARLIMLIEQENTKHACFYSLTTVQCCRKIRVCFMFVQVIYLHLKNI